MPSCIHKHWIEVKVICCRRTPKTRTIYSIGTSRPTSLRLHSTGLTATKSGTYSKAFRQRGNAVIYTCTPSRLREVEQAAAGTSDVHSPVSGFNSHPNRPTATHSDHFRLQNKLSGFMTSSLLHLTGASESLDVVHIPRLHAVATVHCNSLENDAVRSRSHKQWTQYPEVGLLFYGVQCLQVMKQVRRILRTRSAPSRALCCHDREGPCS